MEKKLIEPTVPKSAVVLQGGAVVGDVELGDNCSVWYNAVVRGDLSPIRIGKGSNVQDNCILHTSGSSPMMVGTCVTVGHGAILHGCNVGDNTLIGMGSIVMDDAEIGKNCMIGAGSLVTAGTVVPDGHLAFGSPAKVVRKVTEKELNANRMQTNYYYEMSKNAAASNVVIGK